VLCIAGPLAGTTYQVTDIGRAMISGKCKDIGRVKGPILRGLAARALFPQRLGRQFAGRRRVLRPRVSIGLADQQKTDLVAFLNAL